MLASLHRHTSRRKGKGTVTLKEALTIAIDNRDARVAGRVADQLRERGWTYARILQLAQSIRPRLTMGDWEDLMMESEELESRGEAER